MQRIVLAALFVAAIVAIGAIVARGLARYFEAAGPVPAQKSGNNMQKVAFFLLLVLMGYAIMSGAS